MFTSARVCEALNRERRMH